MVQKLVCSFALLALAVIRAVIQFDDFAWKPAWRNPVQENQQMILDSWDGGHFAIPKCPMTVACDSFSRHLGCVEPSDLVPTSDVAKVAGRRAWAQNRHGQAGAKEFFGERFGERKHISLGRVINGHAGAGLESGDRTDVENAAAPARDHGGQKKTGEVRQ